MLRAHIATLATKHWIRVWLSSQLEVPAISEGQLEDHQEHNLWVYVHCVTIY